MAPIASIRSVSQSIIDVAVLGPDDTGGRLVWNSYPLTLNGLPGPGACPDRTGGEQREKRPLTDKVSANVSARTHRMIRAR